METQNRLIPSLNGPAPVPPAPRDGPNSRWLLRTETGPAPAPPVQVPNSRIGRLARRVDQKGSEILLGARGPQAFRRLDSLPPHPPSRRLTWQRPCPPPASARRAPLQRPSHADLGPVARRCASGIAPSRPSLPPAAPRRRGCLTTRRRSAPYGGVCWLQVPPRSSPGLIRRHSQQRLRKGSCPSSTRRLATLSSTRSDGRKWLCKGKTRCTKM